MDICDEKPPATVNATMDRNAKRAMGKIRTHARLDAPRHAHMSSANEKSPDSSDVELRSTICR